MSKRNRLILLPKKRDAFKAIRLFMCDAGGVTLKAEEEKILDRWIYCDALLRAKEDDEDSIIRKIAEKFEVSVHTARNDISFTMRLFADSRKLNKKYLIHLHLQRIDEDIQIMKKALFKTEIGEGGRIIQHTPDAKELAAYAKLVESYTYTLNSIPEDVQVDKQPPPIFHFLLAPGQVIERPMLLEDALAQADAILLKKNKSGVYTSEEDNDDE